jgi:LytR cell envelope-related transcriptional attenuator
VTRTAHIALAVVFVTIGVGAVLVHRAARASAPAQAGAPPPMSFDPGKVPLDHRIRVEVLNAAGNGGWARAATERLRRLGFDVVYYGNAGSFGRDTSVVLARTDDDTQARRVAAALGIGPVRSRPDSARLVDVSVILGADWGGGKGMAPPPPKRESWLQRLLRR